jgi:hypothetical protein
MPILLNMAVVPFDDPGAPLRRSVSGIDALVTPFKAILTGIRHQLTVFCQLEVR